MCKKNRPVSMVDVLFFHWCRIVRDVLVFAPFVVFLFFLVQAIIATH